AAEKTGKAAGLFVPSGTMGNLAAVLAHCGRGDEAVMGNLGHTFLFEGGGIAALGGVFPHTLPNQPDGSLRLDDIRAAVRPDDVHHPRSRLLILENTHNRCGGVVLTPEYTRQAADVAHEHGMQVHLDGARLFNAAVALGRPAKELTAPVDSVTFCLSKALSAPVGSVLCGSQAFIAEARRIRKQLGGGMRQAGVLAAAGIIALEQMVDRLADDHRRARQLAAGLAAVDGISLVFGQPQTNMVFIDIAESVSLTTAEFAACLKRENILIGLTGSRRFRFVLHCWITDEDVQRTIETVRRVVQAG
ncbi:MAG TPA: GntG family PLP-dependent aldolase, partial [Anaerolineaceae bacterium]|nr:GntG family PLP-dependent aldolase [Anaerolineaceae bacterium]